MMMTTWEPTCSRLRAGFVGDGLHAGGPFGPVGDVFSFGGAFVGGVVEVGGGEERPHDRDAIVDEFCELADIDFVFGEDVEFFAFAPNVAADVFEKKREAGAAAHSGIAGHGEEIHIRRHAELAHATFGGGRSAIAFGALVDHGDVGDDDVAIGAGFDIVARALAVGGFGDAFDAAFLVGELVGFDGDADELEFFL